LSTAAPVIQLTVVTVEPREYGDAFRFAVRLVDCPNLPGCLHAGEQVTAIYMSSAELHSYPSFQRRVLQKLGRLYWLEEGERGSAAWRRALRRLLPS
jgi:hypothetical protein